MRKRAFALILVLLAVLVLPVRALAATDAPLVVDNAGLLTQDERESLEEQAQAFRDQWQIDPVIVTVDSLDGASPQDFADDYFDYNGYGYGPEHDGVLFLLAMEERSWYISTCGNAIYALTDYGIQQLGEAMVPDLSAGNYAEAFGTFLEDLAPYLEAYEQGRPIDGYADYSGDYYHGDQDYIEYWEGEVHITLPIAPIVGLVAAAITVGVMAYGMNTRRRQRGAMDYLRPGSYHLRTHQDFFLYSSVSKTRRQQNNGPRGGGGGGSSVHRSSSGRTHGGGGGRF